MRSSCSGSRSRGSSCGRVDQPRRGKKRLRLGQIGRTARFRMSGFRCLYPHLERLRRAPPLCHLGPDWGGFFQRRMTPVVRVRFVWLGFSLLCQVARITSHPNTSHPSVMRQSRPRRGDCLMILTQSPSVSATPGRLSLITV